MFTTQPSGFAEIAAIDVNPGGVGDNMFKEIAGFKEEIRPLVCRAGGDGAIAYANGYGMYIKATVLKRMAPEASASAGAGAAPATSQGCQMDTECKGERVCEKRKCVDPASAAAPAAAASPAP
jgi:hypothetical protein